MKTKQNLNGLNHHTEELKSIRSAAKKADYTITKSIRKITRDVLIKSVDLECKKESGGNVGGCIDIFILSLARFLKTNVYVP